MSLTGLLGKYLFISQLVNFLRAREKSTHIFNMKTITMALLVWLFRYDMEALSGDSRETTISFPRKEENNVCV